MALSNSQQAAATVPARLAVLNGMLGLVMTGLKPLWAIPMIWYMADAAFLAGAAVVGFIVWDHFDGVLFRGSPLAVDQRLGRLRRGVDVFGDRVVVHSSFIAALQKVAFPLELYLAILGRELVLLAIVSMAMFKTHRVIEPNWWSRGATFCIALSALSWLSAQPPVSVVAVVLMWCLSAVGFWRYFHTP